MDETMTFRAYGEQVIRERLHKMLVHVRAVRRGDDVEALHDMRVASRRLRAAIAVFETAFPIKEFTAFEREVKKITDALGPARDTDVMLETLVQLEGLLPRYQREGIESFAERQRLARIRQQRDVIAAFDRLEHLDLERWFNDIADHADASAEKAAAEEENGGEA